MLSALSGAPRRISDDDADSREYSAMVENTGLEGVVQVRRPALCSRANGASRASVLQLWGESKDEFAYRAVEPGIVATQLAQGQLLVVETAEGSGSPEPGEQPH